MAQVLSQSGQQEAVAGFCTFRTVLLCIIGSFSFTLLVAAIFILLREGPPPLTRKDEAGRNPSSPDGHGDSVSAEYTSSQVCDVRECQEHAALVARTLNSSLDPCQDFSAFVCSGWRPLVDYSDSVEVDARIRWTTSLVAHISEGQASFRIMNKPEALYRQAIISLP
ncbi:hypothetical protein HPB50_016188 [Hyalomma asiaticum]|uniref:Uncharacterized protein n=1 Tax=Hyalomma asiaticum TaxID=266040 RepID=A0ACB7TNK9_HYAAI|nr:hypothetical protein HPB50_016188 [Hyalomma asiaticum]